MPSLRVSEDRRFLVREDGSPFFYLGDTAWELFHRCTRAETELYLRDRAAKGFTVIQAVVLAESDGLRAANADGALPLHENDPRRPNEAYFAHVDWVVDRAAALGLTVGMLPTWGDKWNRSGWGAGPEVFTPDNAFTYGEFLGRRYKTRPIIWILGGDRPVQTEEHRAILSGMASGLREGDGDTHLVSFHPPGGRGSSEFWPGDAPLDFHMCQSGHRCNSENWRHIERDYARQPAKPCLDAEPGYEDHTSDFNVASGYLDDYDVRKSAYWAVFAGACGHTYGCHPIWQMWMPGRQPYTWVRRPWVEALHLPGSGQMQHVRALVQSRPYLSRVPDQSLIAGDPGQGVDHVRATRDTDGSWAMVYLPSGKPVTLDLSRLAPRALAVWWFDPRTGLAEGAGTVTGGQQHEFTPPPAGPDWVLVLDDPARRFAPPGTRPA